MVAHQDINDEEKKKRQKSQPHQGTLFEILFKGMEKIMADVTAIAFYNMVGCVMKCRGGGSDGKNRDTAQQPETVQHNHIK